MMAFLLTGCATALSVTAESNDEVIPISSLQAENTEELNQSSVNPDETGITPTPSGDGENQESAQASEMTAIMETCKAVLQGNTEFFSTDANKNLNISQLNQAVSDDSNVTATVTKFAIVDLDIDGTSEVILWLTVNNDDYYGFEVLRYQNGMVYGYTLWYRSFMDLKANGRFSFSSGAADSGFGTLAFTENTYSIDKITYSESSYDSNNNMSISYFVNQQSATEDEFLSAVNRQGEEPDVTWYDFTDENIVR